jgi:phosphatidylserine decarboxylase
MHEDHRTQNAYLQRVIAHVHSNRPRVLTPALQEFRAFIESTPRVYMYFVQMFDEIPWKWPYWRDLHGKPQIRDYEHLLQVLNHIVRTAPGVDSAIPPMAAILAYPMGTPRYADEIEA